MPTHEELARFWRDFDQLTPMRQRRFFLVLRDFIADVDSRNYRPRLRVKPVQGHDGIWEMTWAPDGRATFEYSDDRPRQVTHVIWRRIATTSSATLEPARGTCPHTP